MVIFGYVWRFFFTSDGYRISARFPSVCGTATLFQRFRGFPDPGFQWKRSRPRKFLLTSPSEPRDLHRPLPFCREIPSFQHRSFYICSRFTMPRKEVVRFSSFESASVPHERRAARAISAHNILRGAKWFRERDNACLVLRRIRCALRFTSRQERKVSARIILWNIYNVASARRTAAETASESAMCNV